MAPQPARGDDNPPLGAGEVGHVVAAEKVLELDVFLGRLAVYRVGAKTGAAKHANMFQHRLITFSSLRENTESTNLL